MDDRDIAIIREVVPRIVRESKKATMVTSALWKDLCILDDLVAKTVDYHHSTLVLKAIIEVASETEVAL